MDRRSRSPRSTNIWTYTYQIMPPQSEHRLVSVRAVLEEAHAEARLGKRTWGAHIVSAAEATHILVVSDSPDQDAKVNRTLEAELRALQAVFSMSTALRVEDDGRPKPLAH